MSTRAAFVGPLIGETGPGLAPALYTFLAISWGEQGWLVIAAVVVVASAGLHRSARTAQRFLGQHGPDGAAAVTEDAPLSPAIGP